MIRQDLRRSLGLRDAIVIGLGSMIGAGVFSVFAPAAAAAGTGLLIGLVIAGVVATCNAMSSAQLAATYPTSGGTYVYGREQLGQWWGFCAGWSFIVGKTASCAAMALTFAAYAAPNGWDKPAALAAVIAVAVINFLGVKRTAQATIVIVSFVLVVLALVVLAGFTSATGAGSPFGNPLPHGWYGVLQSAGLLFFAFAGYARIATMGEEVVSPRKTIPRAILIALTLAVAVYAAIGWATLAVLGPQELSAATEPLAQVVEAAGWLWANPIVRVAAAAASLGALLALTAGIGRTSLAMARERDLPHWLGAVHPQRQVPHRAEFVLAIVVCVLVLLVDLRYVIGFSSFGVLLYYLVANAAAVTQTKAQRRFPKIVQMLGVLGCFVLMITLPLTSAAAGLAVVVVGFGYRAIRLRFAHRPTT